MTNHSDYTTSGTPFQVNCEDDGTWTLSIAGYGQRNIHSLKSAISIANRKSPFCMVVVGLRKI